MKGWISHEQILPKTAHLLCAQGEFQGPVSGPIMGILPDNFVWEVPITIWSEFLLRLPMIHTLDLSTGTFKVFCRVTHALTRSRDALNDEDLSEPVASYLLQRSALMLELLRGPRSKQLLIVQM